MKGATWTRLIRPVVGRIANMVSRGTLRSVDFEQALPRALLDIQAGEQRQGVPFLQPQGFSSNPVVGREALVVCFGGMKAAAHVVMVIDGEDRPTDLAQGESEIYAPNGARFVCRLGGAVEIFAPGGGVHHGDLSVNGSLQVSGSISASGSVSDGTGSMQAMRDTYNGHRHGNSSGPNNQMGG